MRQARLAAADDAPAPSAQRLILLCAPSKNFRLLTKYKTPTSTGICPTAAGNEAGNPGKSRTCCTACSAAARMFSTAYNAMVRHIHFRMASALRLVMAQTAHKRMTMSRARKAPIRNCATWSFLSHGHRHWPTRGPHLPAKTPALSMSARRVMVMSSASGARQGKSSVKQKRVSLMLPQRRYTGWRATIMSRRYTWSTWYTCWLNSTYNTAVRTDVPMHVVATRMRMRSSADRPRQI
mmetsp:Transcript_72702/g.222624  ORF Transcript_72702/g.222624 Transcript_72702/m.222624 type:complete len:237 (+) Transcript_72702:1033-1743(+)